MLHKMLHNCDAMTGTGARNSCYFCYESLQCDYIPNYSIYTYTVHEYMIVYDMNPRRYGQIIPTRVYTMINHKLVIVADTLSVW